MSPTKLPSANEVTLSPEDKKHIRDAWTWAATIIAVGMLLVLSGVVNPVPGVSSADFEKVIAMP